MAETESERVASILRGVLRLGRRLRAERPPGGVALSANGIMSTLNRLGPIAAKRLAMEERLQPQSLTRILAGLERDGCIERQRSSADRREMPIVLTPHGRRILAADMEGRRRWLEHALANGLTTTEREALLAAAPAMFKLAQYDGDAPPTGGDQ